MILLVLLVLLVLNFVNVIHFGCVIIPMHTFMTRLLDRSKAYMELAELTLANNDTEKFNEFTQKCKRLHNYCVYINNMKTLQKIKFVWRNR